MTDKEQEIITEENENSTDPGHVSTSSSLGDEQRIKVLSPGMLVVKRFIRNRLAIIGLIIIAFMFVFSFIGGIVTPYGETQVFKYVGTMSKEYASITYNNDYKYTVAEDMEYTNTAHSAFILARNSGKSSFSVGDQEFHIVEEGEEFYRIVTSEPMARITSFRGLVVISALADENISQELNDAVLEAVNNGDEQFNFDGELYTITQSGREYILGKSGVAAFESKNIFDPAIQGQQLSHDFSYAAEVALRTEGVDTFTVEGVDYFIEEDGNLAIIYKGTGADKEEYALLSRLSIHAASPDVFLSIDFKKELSEAIDNDKKSIMFDRNGDGEVEYTISRLNNIYTVKSDTLTHLISIHEKPSKVHWLGTDKHGMDVLTRLMYGGRISLIIGFIVVLLESALGVIMGGIAGYFGKWVDMLIMRIVDVFNCIPFMPLLIILGSVMDAMEVQPQHRIYLLMIILGIMSWPGIARMVRGQILSLREQEFMLAAEATGLSVTRRIFKHLVPNVIPQLIVIATMGLGSVILYESTLSFLGLGVKFPLASWGNIISGVSTAFEMTNFWFVWIPAGTLILLTVLGFNFVGDGLRDAFDPKMKR
ncbi:MAG: ABC transporter permease [Gudongella sp.]|nr:ABC transporter permease [Gudongella sp.]